MLRLGDALARLEAGTLPPRSVVITFDDGTRDFAEIVTPLLREFAMPATVYLTTYYCEHRWPVFDTALGYLAWRAHAVGVNVAGAALAMPARAGRGQRPEEVAAEVKEEVERRGLSAREKHHLLERVAIAAGVDFEEFLNTGMYQQMTADQVAALPGDLIDVELHTHRHRTPRVHEAFAREIRDNRSHLDRYRPGERFAHFCYPSGDYWGEFIGWLGGLGVTSATTCVAGLATARGNRMLLPRFLDSGLISDITFDAWTSGVAALLPRRATHRFEARRVESRSDRSLADGTLIDRE